MKAGQVRGLTLDQLNDELVKLKKEQFNLRFQPVSAESERSRARRSAFDAPLMRLAVFGPLRLQHDLCLCHS